MCRLLVVVLATCRGVTVFARESTELERDTIALLRQAGEQRFDGGATFEGTYEVEVARNHLAGADRKFAEDRVRAIIRSQYLWFIRAEDVVALRSRGINVEQGLQVRELREVIDKRIDELLEARGDILFLHTQPWRRTYQFTAWFDRGKRSVRCDSTMAKQENEPTYPITTYVAGGTQLGKWALEQVVLGYDRYGTWGYIGARTLTLSMAGSQRLGADQECLEYFPHVPAAQRQVYKRPGEGRLAATGLPDPFAAGIPMVTGVGAEDIRVLDERPTVGGIGVMILTRVGETVQLIEALPKYDYHVARCRTYQNGRLVAEEKYGNWTKLRGQTWYPLEQEVILVKEVQIRRDLERQLRDGEITTTNMKLLENQTPVRWYRYKRAITRFETFVPPKEKFELTVPSGGQMPQFEVSVIPLF